MPLHAVNHARGTITHHCDRCGHPRELRLHPDHGEVHYLVEAGTRCITLPPCPHCAGWPDPTTGEPTFVWHTYPRVIAPWEAGDGEPPESLVGTVLPLDNGGSCVVTEHTSGWSRDPRHVAYNALIRQMQLHPHVRPHLLKAGPHPWLTPTPAAEAVAAVADVAVTRDPVGVGVSTRGREG